MSGLSDFTIQGTALKAFNRKEEWCCTIKIDNENSRIQYKEKCK